MVACWTPLREIRSDGPPQWNESPAISSTERPRSGRCLAMLVVICTLARWTSVPAQEVAADAESNETVHGAFSGALSLIRGNFG